jgi:hypothetical protein
MEALVNPIYTLLMLLLISLPASGQVLLYDNGTDPGNIYGWLVNNGHSVSNSFKLEIPSTMTAVNISLYDVDKYNVPQSLDWRILTRPHGNVIAYGSAHSMRMLDGQVNYFLFYQWLMQFDIVPALNLSPGTYWLEISNARNVLNTGLLWGENDGPSRAFFSGALGGEWKHGGHDHGGSESFQVLGFLQN